MVTVVLPGGNVSEENPVKVVLTGKEVDKSTRVMSRPNPIAKAVEWRKSNG